MGNVTTWEFIVRLLYILGGLGIFLFGMRVMSEGIQKVAGEGMRRIMATMTQNRFFGLFTGLLVTCLVQSSSATTVMVVSFVNAQLLTLMESIGVIMGANLGTTLTGWIIATIGKFSLSKIALPIIGIGLPLVFMSKPKFKHTGEFLVGFGLLFFGLSELKNAVPDVKSLLKSADPGDQALVADIQGMIEHLNSFGFGSVIIFLVIGVFLTILVQSSSAAMGITIIVAINGWINFEIAAAIVLGENIGTTVTAWLASIGANLNAKRAARAHFIFNIAGVCWMFSSSADQSEEASSRILSGKLVLDEEDHSISIAGEKVDFTLTEFKLLHYFLKRKGRVQTRDNLLLGVWKFDTEVETRTVDVHIRRVRKKIEHSGLEIETIRGVGYRLIEQSTPRS